MKLKAVLLTEGSQQQGFGHVSRCLSIAQGLHSQGISASILVDSPTKVGPILKGFSHETKDWKDLKKLESIVHESDVVVVDSYTVSQQIIDFIAYAAKVPVFVDDNLQKSYPRGIVLNGNIYGRELTYPQKPTVSFLLGEKFVPLRKAFWKRNSLRNDQHVRRVLIMFGGTDARKLTPKAIRFMGKLYPHVSLDVVVGNGFEDCVDVSNSVPQSVNIYRSLDDKAIRAVMMKADVALSSSGQSLYELARVGVPTLGVAVAKNQLRNLHGFVHAKIVQNAGWYTDVHLWKNIEKIFKRIQTQSIRKKISLQSRLRVDGLGPQRIAKGVLSFAREQGVLISPAKAKDSRDVLHLSNEKSVRDVSFVNKKITLKEHRRWFRGKISQGQSLFLLARHPKRNDLMGQIRYEKTGSAATISISVAARYRQQSVGKILFMRSLGLVRDHLKVKVLNAYIRSDNDASIRFFHALGFKKWNELKISKEDAVLYRKVL